MHLMRYKGYEMHAIATPLAYGKWDATVNIMIWREGVLKSRAFAGPDNCTSKDKAISYCFAFGKQIIDGDIVSFSVGDL
jgi:hypothetical protein